MQAAGALRSIDDGLWRLDEQVLIPVDDLSLQTRILVVAHCGSAGHYAHDFTFENLRKRFTWPGMEEQCRQMCANCLHCVPNRGGGRVPRPWGETLTARERFEVLHLDWLYIVPPNGSHHAYKYVLVLKDDYSGNVWLRPSATANSRVTAEYLLDWIAAYKTPDFIVTDQGSHFINETLEELSMLRKMQHHIVVAYSPNANGTVERVNRELLARLRALLDEADLEETNWPYLLPIVQHAINHSPSTRLGNQAPFTALTAMPAESPLDTIFLPDASRQFVVLSTAAIRKHTAEVAAALEGIHRTIDRARQDRQCQNAKSRSKISRHHNFIVGDYVLVARVQKAGDKLKARWTGPHRIVQTVSDHVVMVEDIVNDRRTREVHTQRVRPYADSLLNVTETIKRHAERSDGQVLLGVDRLLKVRENENTNDIEILVAWQGFEEAEFSWEPAVNILEDVPKLYKALLRGLKKKNPLKKRMQQLMRK